MPSLNINSLFAAKKKNTVPVAAVPKNVKQSLCIDRIYAGGIFQLEPQRGTAMYDCAYMFEDINYINLDNDKKKNTLLELMVLFRAMDEQFKITVASEQQDMNAFMEEVFQPLHGEEYPLLEKGIGQWINQKIGEGTRDIRRVLLLTVTCRAASIEEAEAYFATLDTALQNIFRNLRSRLYRMGGTERLALLQRMLRAGGQGIPPENISKDDDSWKNQVLPSSIEQDTDYLVIDNQRYVSILFGHDYGQTGITLRRHPKGSGRNSSRQWFFSGNA